MFVIRELSDNIKFFDVNVSNYQNFDPVEVVDRCQRIQQRLRLTVKMSELAPQVGHVMVATSLFEHTTALSILLAHPRIIPWVALADLIVLINDDGRQRILKDRFAPG